MNLHVNAPHFFLDLDGIASANNLSIVPGIIAKDYERPIVSGEEPWEAFMAALLEPPADLRGGRAHVLPLLLLCVSNKLLWHVHLPRNHHGWAHLAKACAHRFSLGRRAAHKPRLFKRLLHGHHDGPGVPAAERYKLLYTDPALRGHSARNLVGPSPRAVRCIRQGRQ